MTAQKTAATETTRLRIYIKETSYMLEEVVTGMKYTCMCNIFVTLHVHNVLLFFFLGGGGREGLQI